jgi:alpha-beta hydrolase superfamily lysophospholipase
MFDRARDLSSHKVGAEDWNDASILGLHGTDDYCCNHEATREFFEALPVKDKTLLLYDGVYHCSKLLQ